MLHYGTPSFGQSMATGLRQIEEQAALGGWPPEARQASETRFISGVHRRISESYAGGDVILGAEHLRLFGPHMTPEDRTAAWQALSGPLVQIQAVADADTPGIANAATAPLTPWGDPALLVQRMLAITPAKPAGNDASGAGDTTDLPALVAQYGGDAAKAWAASAIGTDALDALVAQHGASWFGAMPKDARNQVAANMAMLGAATSPRRAPTPAERADLAGDIEDQPWSDERKQNAYAELNTRIGLEAKRVKQAQDDAWEKGLGVAEKLGAGFISINQLPPAVRTGLGPEALAALTLRADRNVHPVTVPAHGDVAMGLNQMAASDPEGFSKIDLRLYRDQIRPAEYDALDRAQKAWGGYPPGAHGVTQQRSLEKVRASGLDVGLAATIASQYEDATGSSRSTQPPPTDEEVDRLANVGTIPAALRGADATKATVRAMLLRGWTSDQIQNQLYDSYVASHLRHGLESPGESIGPEADTGEPDPAASGDQVETIGNSPGMSQAAHLMPVNYGTGKRRATKPKPSAPLDEIPAWLQKQRRSILRSPVYLSTSQDSDDKDVYDGLKRMGNPDDLTIIFSHGSPATGQTTDKSRGIDPATGSDRRFKDAGHIFTDLLHKNFVHGTPILLTSCFGANDDTARQLSAMTGGIVYVAKAYVTAPSAAHHRYDLSVYTSGPGTGKRTGYAKFDNGKEVPSELLALRYNENTHQWSRVNRTPPAPVGDRVPAPITGFRQLVHYLTGW